MGPEFDTGGRQTFFFRQAYLYTIPHAVKGVRKAPSGLTHAFHSMWIFKLVVFVGIRIKESEIFIVCHSLSCAKQGAFPEGRGTMN